MDDLQTPVSGKPNLFGKSSTPNGIEWKGYSTQMDCQPVDRNASKHSIEGNHPRNGAVVTYLRTELILSDTY